MRTSYFDVVDQNDEPLGSRASYDEVHSKGLWHRGVHVIIYTPDRQIVMQKRSPSLKYHPSEVEISVGGGVEAGEEPVQGAIREVKEELGIVLHPRELRFVGKTKYNHAQSRNFIYSYAACLPEERLAFTLNAEESSSAFLLSEKKLRVALRRHRISRVGRITSTYAYWRYLLDAIQPTLLH